MEQNLNEIWNYLDKIEVSKVYISYCFKRKIDDKIEIKIENIIVVLKSPEKEISWDHEIFKDNSVLTWPIYNHHKDFIGKADGLLTYDNNRKKIYLSGKFRKKITEVFKVEMDSVNDDFKINFDADK